MIPLALGGSLLIGLIGALAGGLVAAWFLGNRARTARSARARAERELARVTERNERLTETLERARTMADSALEHAIEEIHKRLRARQEARAGLKSAIEELGRILADASKADGEALRRTEVLGREQGERLRALLAETQTLSREASEALAAGETVGKIIRDLEKGAEGLKSASLDAVRATTQMDDALRRVTGGAGDTANISARVSSEAERGYRSVHRTLDEIERIRELSKVARQQIDALGVRVVGIGDVVRVIQEIAERTNLLALNASIIAAQAGEHGRGFAVVAQEIKALAMKTASSTKQIGEQIHGVQEESERAMEAMATGVSAVNEGFQVALGAGDALGEIRQSARAAQKKVQAITRAMDEQSGASSRVVTSAGELADRANALVTSVKRQGSLSERLKDQMQHIAEAASRLGEAARQHTRTEEATRELLTQLGQEVTRLSTLRKDLLRRLDALHHGADKLGTLEEDVESQLAALREAAAELREELSRS